MNKEMVAYLLALVSGCVFQPTSIVLDTEPTITVNELSELTLPKADVLQSSGQPVWPERGVTWTVTPPEVAELGPEGTVVLIGDGDATVTASVGEISASYVIHVALPDEIAIRMAPVVPLEQGQTFPVEAFVMADDTALVDHDVTWSTGDPNVATVADGLVTAVAPGTTTLVATWGDLRAERAVTITPPVAAADLGAEELDDVE